MPTLKEQITIKIDIQENLSNENIIEEVEQIISTIGKYRVANNLEELSKAFSDVLKNKTGGDSA